MEPDRRPDRRQCLSDADGVLTIPNLGTEPLRPVGRSADGLRWIQTTTLEGNHDWDAWVMEGATGLDTEFVVAGEPFPAIIFGFVPGPNTDFWGSRRPPLPRRRRHDQGCRRRRGRLRPANGRLESAQHRRAADLRDQGRPADRQARGSSLADLKSGDTAVWVGRGDADGTFNIPDVPDGNYTLTWWDEPQNYILDLINVTVNDGETVDTGILPLTGWWTEFDGYVFNDTNRNGVNGPRRDRAFRTSADHAQARELADGPRLRRGDHRRRGHYVFERPTR